MCGEAILLEKTAVSLAFGVVVRQVQPYASLCNYILGFDSAAGENRKEVRKLRIIIALVSIMRTSGIWLESCFLGEAL